MLVVVFKCHFISILIKPCWTERSPFKQILSKLTLISGEWNKLKKKKIKKSVWAPRALAALDCPEQHHLALEPHPLPLSHGAPFKLSPGCWSCSQSDAQLLLLSASDFGEFYRFKVAELPLKVFFGFFFVCFFVIIKEEKLKSDDVVHVAKKQPCQSVLCPVT